MSIVKARQFVTRIVAAHELAKAYEKKEGDFSDLNNSQV
jgi:hypothetical protein